MSRFPNRTETFVVSDIQATLEWCPQADVIAVFRKKGKIPSWISKTHYFRVPSIYFRSHWWALRKNPGLYFRLLRELLVGYRGNLIEWVKIMAAWPAMIAAARFADEQQYDVIHAHWGNAPATMAYVITSFVGKPFTLTTHAFDIYKKNTFLGPKLEKAALCLTCTAYNRRYLLDTYPQLPDDRIQVAYHGVDLQRFSGVDNGKDNDTFTMVTVGRMTAQKGFEDLMDALGLLRQRGVAFHLLFLALPGPREEAIRERIATHQLADHIEYVLPLPQNEMAALYQRADLAVLPCVIGPDGDRDGLPNFLLEAAACALPLVSTSISAVPELVISGETGLLVEPGHVEGLAEAVESLAADAELRKTLGSQARHHVEKYFDRQICQKRICELLREVHG